MNQFSQLCAYLYIMSRIPFFFLLFSLVSNLVAQKDSTSGSLRMGLTYDFHKFNQFVSVQGRWVNQKIQFGCSMGISPQKASQGIAAGTIQFDYSWQVPIKSSTIGPVITCAMDSYVFGTRFTYVHSAVGYRFTWGKSVRFFQESTLGPTVESYDYMHMTHRHLTFNYHLKFGLLYALR